MMKVSGQAKYCFLALLMLLFTNNEKTVCFNLAVSSVFTSSREASHRPENRFLDVGVEAIYGGAPGSLSFYPASLKMTYADMYDASFETEFTLPENTFEIQSSDARFLFVSSEKNHPVNIHLRDVNNSPGITVAIFGELPNEEKQFVSVVWAKKEEFIAALDELLLILQRKSAFINRVAYQVYPQGYSENIQSNNMLWLRSKVLEKFGNFLLQDHSYGCAIDQWGHLFSTNGLSRVIGFRPIETMRKNDGEPILTLNRPPHVWIRYLRDDPHYWESIKQDYDLFIRAAFKGDRSFFPNPSHYLVVDFSQNPNQVFPPYNNESFEAIDSANRLVLLNQREATLLLQNRVRNLDEALAVLGRSKEDQELIELNLRSNLNREASRSASLKLFQNRLFRKLIRFRADSNIQRGPLIWTQTRPDVENVRLTGYFSRWTEQVKEGALSMTDLGNGLWGVVVPESLFAFNKGHEFKFVGTRQNRPYWFTGLYPSVFSQENPKAHLMENAWVEFSDRDVFSNKNRAEEVLLEPFPQSGEIEFSI